MSAGKRALEAHFLAGHGMLEAEQAGVQRLARERARRALRAGSGRSAALVAKPAP